MKTDEELNKMVNKILSDNALMNANGGTTDIDILELELEIERKMRQAVEEALREAGLSEEEIRRAMMDYDSHRPKPYHDHPTLPIL